MDWKAKMIVSLDLEAKEDDNVRLTGNTEQVGHLRNEQAVLSTLAPE